MSAPAGAQPDWNAIVDALADQIDDLSAAIGAQQKLIEAHDRLIIELAHLAGLGADPGDKRR